MRRRLWLLLAAALVVIVLLLYPSTQCRVSKADLSMSELSPFVVPVEQGYAVGFSFNMTNHANCEAKAQAIHAVLRGSIYADGRQVSQNVDEREGVDRTISPGQSAAFSYTFNSYFDYRPTALLLRVELTFAETEPVLVFDGQLPVSA